MRRMPTDLQLDHSLRLQQTRSLHPRQPKMRPKRTVANIQKITPKTKNDSRTQYLAKEAVNHSIDVNSVSIPRSINISLGSFIQFSFFSHFFNDASFRQKIIINFLSSIHSLLLKKVLPHFTHRLQSAGIVMRIHAERVPTTGHAAKTSLFLSATLEFKVFSRATV